MQWFSPYSADSGLDGAVGKEDAGKKDATADDDDAGETVVEQCVPNPDDDGTCPEICPEVCDGEDNDCDGSTDEGEAADSCELPNASAECAEGACLVAECQGLFGDCDGEDSNGCERSLDTETDCGRCGEECGELDNAVEVGCVQGECSPLACEPGFDNCDKESENGCESTLDTLEHCGGCDTACDGASCAGGVCSELDCGDGLADCDGDTDNGCEASLNTVTDCGACGRTCAPNNATARCNQGKCEFVGCKPGFDDCDSDQANGCETALDKLSDCGECEKVCRVPDGEPSCAGGICTAASCGEGLADCDGDISNGCETSLRTLDNCGVCGQTCGPYPDIEVTCETGVCQMEHCEEGYWDCDGDPLNGCESALKDNQNCGQCGNICAFDHATASCSTGACVFTACVSGWGNCDGDTGNGCETPLDTEDNCGSCGHECGSSEQCCPDLTCKRWHC